MRLETISEEEEDYCDENNSNCANTSTPMSSCSKSKSFSSQSSCCSSTMSSSEYGGSWAAAAASSSPQKQQKQQLLPYGFTPHLHLLCIHCKCNHVICQCQKGHSSTSNNSDSDSSSVISAYSQKGSNLIFGLLPTPNHLSTKQRIRRWAALIHYHPILQDYNVDEDMIAQLPSSFLHHDLKAMKPLMQTFMTNYINSTRDDIGLDQQLKEMDLEDKKEECVQDCQFIIDHFFTGNWSYVTLLQYCFLHNAIQMTDPEDFDEETTQKIHTVFCVVSYVMNMMLESFGSSHLHYGLELIWEQEQEWIEMKWSRFWVRENGRGRIDGNLRLYIKCCTQLLHKIHFEFL